MGIVDRMVKSIYTYLGGFDMKEVFRPIKDYEGLYQVSNFGRIKSNDGWYNRDGLYCDIIESTVGSDGYNHIYLSSDGLPIMFQRIFPIHQLVYDHIGKGKRNGRILEVDHIDENKLNNRIDNLQLLSHRENISKYHRTQKTSSKYTGVTWNKWDKSWRAQIVISWKLKHLGFFRNEYNAHAKYQEVLSNIM